MVKLLDRPLRGVARRQAEAFELLHEDHESELVPLFQGTIAVAREKDFIAALMSDLKASDWRERMLKRPAISRNGATQLHQPIHKEFSVAFFEARCQVPGRPRIDPRKLVAQGMVVRKLTPGGLLGWKHAKGDQRGWLPVNGHDDPLGTKSVSTGHAEIDRLLARKTSAGLLQEDVAPLFIAPPDVCDALGKTVLFGIVPVTSNEQAATEPVDFLAIANSDNGELDSHLSSFLRPDMSPTPPQAGALLEASWAQSGPYLAFATAIRQLVQEAGLDDDTAQAQSLRDVLNGLGILAFVREAGKILVDGRPNQSDLRMPPAWPRATIGLRNAFYQAMGARFASVASHSGKFDERDASYELAAFVRLTCGACPPKLIWCQTMPHFQILPWWQGAGAPMRIPLPDFDLANLPRLKPNVSFEVPRPLAKFLNQDFSNALKSPPGQGIETGITWICSFSIPIITICAFILLSIIITLLNILFFWLPLVKICLPLPKVKRAS